MEVSTITAGDGEVFDVYVCERHLELVCDDYRGALCIEPEDLLHELTARGTLRVSEWKGEGRPRGTVFGISLPQEALAHLRSLARGHALLPSPTIDLTRVRTSGLAS